MMFRGAYRTEFYRALADAIHAEVRGGDTVARVAAGPRAAGFAPGDRKGGLMRLLLTHGYFLAEDVKEQKIMKPYVPLGLLYLSSHLRAKGFDVEIYDSTFGSRDDLFAVLDHGEPATLGIYGNLMTRPNVLAIVARARAAGWRVVLGGPEPANYAEEYLAAGADIIVAGEGEKALERLTGDGFRSCVLALHQRHYLSRCLRRRWCERAPQN